MLTLFYFLLFLLAIVLIAIQPWVVLYRFSDSMAYLLHKIIRYRVNVTRKNLRLVFPNKNEEELSEIEDKTFRNLADISVEALKGFTMRNSQVLKRHTILNPELLDNYYYNGQSIIGVAGHFNNWEWGAMSAGIQLKHHPVAIYKPLSNKLIDWFLKWHRSLRGTIMVPTTQTYDTFNKYRHEPCFFLLVADQSPSRVNKAYWINFLNQDTACIHGPEKYAKLYNYPVVFIDIQRKARGEYTVELTPLTNDPCQLPDGELTKLYMGKLEERIIEHPESWLWTHRRWKKKRPAK